jgi:hypothetical protein
MMNARTKLDKLERKAAALPTEGQDRASSSLAAEVREIDANIRALGAEIKQIEASMTPEEELARSRAEHDEEYRASLDRLSLDEQIRVLEAEIALLEAGEREGAG